MKFYIITAADSNLAAEHSQFIHSVRDALLARPCVKQVRNPGEADFLILEEPFSFKEWRYVARLKNCPLMREAAHKIITINCDDAATGLLRGLYTSLHRRQFDHLRHVSVPYRSTPNELVYSAQPSNKFTSLASWRGNIKSNGLRSQMLSQFSGHSRMRIEATCSWLDHSETEKFNYVQLIQSAAFSLCPAGWAPVSFRIYESMALGRCPVILADGFVPPKGPDWLSFSISFPERKLRYLDQELIRRESEAPNLGKLARDEWDRWFAPDKIPSYYANAILSCAKAGAPRSLEREVAGWSTFSTNWNNGWTLPQRLWSRVRRGVKKLSKPKY